MSKKFAFILVILLVLPSVLTACSSDSADTAKDYVEAILKGDADAAQKYACEGFQDDTKTLAEGYAVYAEMQKVIQDIDLKYDIGKGNNQKEVIVTGAYNVVELNASGKAISDSAKEYVLASSTPDKWDSNHNNDDTDRINTRIVLDMKEEGGDWCVAKLTGGYVLLPGEPTSETESE